MKILTTLKQTITLGLISSTILLRPLNVEALTIEEIPNPRQIDRTWISDTANILSDATETELNRLITDLEAANGTEIAIVTIADTHSQTNPKAFATKLFNYWGIGKAETDNGVLFLISLDERRVEIETGTGLQTILPDKEVKNIIETQITPQYKQDNYDRGTLNGTVALIEALNTSQTTEEGWYWGILSLTGGIGFILTFKGFSWLQKRKERIFVNPQKNHLALQRSDNRFIYCGKCQQPMERVERIELTRPQKVAKNLGGVSFRGYKCSSCSDAKHPYVILSYFSNSDRYLDCPNCQELTVIRTEETIQEATRISNGKLQIEKKCHCCDYYMTIVTTIPRLSSPSSSKTHNPSYNYYDCGASSSGYSGGSSGGDFGGGSSDGGGAGGSW